jgi:signal peptidase I
MLAVGALILVGIPLNIAQYFLPIPNRLGPQIFAAALSLAITVRLATWMFQKVFRTTTGRAFLIWLGALIPFVGFVGLQLFVVRPYVLEMFVVPTNTMAPTLIGWHRTTACPHCSGTTIVGATAPGESDPNEQEQATGMCLSCWKDAEVMRPTGPIASPDRFVVEKFRKPARWDVIVHLYPEERTVLYVKRLVGLPGETVVIKEGAVWINGSRITPPSELQRLTYDAPTGTGLWGAPNNPVQLGPDEYFVLGDFSKRSKDARFFGPILRSDIKGIVTARYWPPSRWKAW